MGIQVWLWHTASQPAAAKTIWEAFVFPSLQVTNAQSLPSETWARPFLQAVETAGAVQDKCQTAVDARNPAPVDLYIA